MGIDATFQGVYVHEWQDLPERNHGEVMAAFDRAIALAEAEGK